MNEKEKVIFNDLIEKPEELLWPPRIDFIGVLLISVISIMIWVIISIGVLIASFFSIGSSTVGSGVSPFLLALATFFMLTIASVLYIYLGKIIFPSIYTQHKELLKHMMIFMMILYFCMMPVYLFFGWSHTPPWQSSVLLPYLFHIILAIFGIELIIGSISQYRYILLSFYANIIALILTGTVLIWIISKFSNSEKSIFILMGLSILSFFLSTTFVFLVKFLYHKFYTITGNDPLGSIFYNIALSEYQKVENAKNTLFKK